MPQSMDIEKFLTSGFLIGISPDKVMMGFGPKKTKSSADLAAPHLYAPDFFLEQKNPWHSYETVQVVLRSELLEKVRSFDKKKLPKIVWTPAPVKQFRKAFDLIQSEIEKKKILKAVPVVFEKTQMEMNQNLLAILIGNLLSNVVKKTPYGYWNLESKTEEGVLGASPEVLFSIDQQSRMVRTMALAGTRASDLEKQSSLAHDAKEMYEHDLVIKGIREKLSGLGKIKITPSYVWDLGPISHLRTDLEIEVDAAETASGSAAFVQSQELLFENLIHRLHPTAALGVSPAGADYKFLKQCDGDQNRMRFGAPFGVLDPSGKSNVVVAIRNIQWNQNEMFLGSGCGIVQASRFENEWNELTIKRNAIKQTLGLET
jgi:menaquinone-specific isochorismate synthase